MEKKKFRFNVVDVIVLVVILAAVAFVGSFFLGGGFGGDGGAEFEVTYLCEEVPEFAASIIKNGDKVLDEQQETELGEVTEVVIGESRTYTTTDMGEIRCLGKPYYNCVMLTTRVKAQKYDYGMMVDSSKYGVGHSITIRVGSAKIFGRVSGIRLIEE